MFIEMFDANGNPIEPPSGGGGFTMAQAVAMAADDGQAVGGPTLLAHAAGRIYAEVGGQWKTPHDDNYGPAYFQWVESGGNGDEPIVEFEWMGDRLPAGTRITRIDLGMKSNVGDVSDVLVFLYRRKPAEGFSFAGGIDADTEMNARLIWKGNLAGIEGYGGETNDRHAWSAKLDDTDADESELIICFKPIVKGRSRRYIPTSYSIWGHTK